MSEIWNLFLSFVSIVHTQQQRLNFADSCCQVWTCVVLSGEYLCCAGGSLAYVSLLSTATAMIFTSVAS